MNIAQVITVFSEHYVRSEFRERFVHEALKKPQKLHARICHSIPDIFPASFQYGESKIKDSEHCLFLGWSAPFIEISWQEAKAKMLGGGGGYLVINSNGTAFHAETEGYPAVIYAAHG